MTSGRNVNGQRLNGVGRSVRLDRVRMRNLSSSWRGMRARGIVLDIYVVMFRPLEERWFQMAAVTSSAGKQVLDQLLRSAPGFSRAVLIF